jgi:hypothetical protein
VELIPELQQRWREFEASKTDARGLVAGLSHAQFNYRADGLDLKRAVVTSPASRFFRMSLGAYLAFLAAHDRRHLWQARQVREAEAFPP